MFKKTKLIIIFMISILSVTSSIITPLSGTINFSTEKGELWKMIKQTPKDANYGLFINGFVGTSMVDKYLNEIVKGEFTIDIIRSYMNSGFNKENEKTLIVDYNKKYQKHQANVITVSHKSHMKSYFWFNKNDEIIRTLSGSGNFSESALTKVKSYKEVLYDITDDKDVSRDLFCGSVQAVEQINTVRAYKKNCQDFNKDDNKSFKSNNKIKTKNQLNDIIEGHKDAKGLIVLTGDGDSGTIKKYLTQTKTKNDIKQGMLLDVFVGNTSTGFKPEQEIQWKQNKIYGERLNIIREHPLSNKITNADSLVNSKVAKTHTKLYVWYNDKLEIVRLLSGSGNFSKNGVENSDAFREVLLELNLERNWKDELVCKIMGTFKTQPRLLIKSFCNV